MPDRKSGFSPVECVIMLVVPAVLFVPVRVYDRQLFSMLNGLHSPWTDPLWLALTTLGDGLVLSIVVSAFLTVNPRVTVMGLLVMLLGSIEVNLIKWLYPTLRPTSVMDSVHLIGPMLRSGSFPSGHTMSSLAAGLSIAYFSPGTAVRAFAIVLAVLMGLSRIFVGVHFPIDVVGGMIFAAGLFLLFALLLWPSMEEKIPQRPDFSSRPLRLAVFAEVAACLWVLAVHAPYYAESGPVAAATAVVVLFFVVRRYVKGNGSRRGTGNEPPGHKGNRPWIARR